MTSFWVTDTLETTTQPNSCPVVSREPGGGGCVAKRPGTTTPHALTLAEAAEVCGTTKKALERRTERGTLEVARHGGVRVIEVAELMRMGLTAPGADVSTSRPAATVDRPLSDNGRWARLMEGRRRRGLIGGGYACGKASPGILLPD